MVHFAAKGSTIPIPSLKQNATTHQRKGRQSTPHLWEEGGSGKGFEYKRTPSLTAKLISHPSALLASLKK